MLWKFLKICQKLQDVSIEALASGLKAQLVVACSNKHFTARCILALPICIGPEEPTVIFELMSYSNLEF